jgi:hypothetical protein
MLGRRNDLKSPERDSVANDLRSQFGRWIITYVTLREYHWTYIHSLEHVRISDPGSDVSDAPSIGALANKYGDVIVAVLLSIAAGSRAEQGHAYHLPGQGLFDLTLEGLKVLQRVRGEAMATRSWGRFG